MLEKDCVATAKAWDEGLYSTEELKSAANIIREKIGDFTPTLIISFSSVPFLKAAFPNAVILHQEAGMLSRAPYPYTGYFDPVGMRGNSSLRKFSNELNSLKLTDNIVRDIAKFRKAYIDECLVPKSPFSDLKHTLRSQFDSIWIWPNQLDTMAGWHTDLPMQSMWDMMTWVLDKAGPKTGIILTEHPSWEMYFSKEKIDYWQATFPNFIYIEKAWNVSANTQFLMEIADGIISLTSSVGFQPLIWGKKLVTIGETQFTDLADANDLNNLNEIALEPLNPQRDAQLYWLLTHFNILQSHLFSGSYLFDFATRCLAAQEQHGEITFDVFQSTIPASQVIEDLIAAKRSNIPEKRTDNPADLNLETYMALAREGTVL